jgi:outer membrane phospholipase A
MIHLNSWIALGIISIGILLNPRISTAEEATPTPERLTESGNFYPRISSYQPSYFGWSFSQEPHLTFQISIQYPFLPFEAFGSNTTNAFTGFRSGLYIAYTGIYDMYPNRTSGPTISREHNPGILLNFTQCFDQPLVLTTGYFHDSNGQVITTREQYQAIPDHAQDFVSRGWDYILLGSEFTFLSLEDTNHATPLHFLKDGSLGKQVPYDPTGNQTHLMLRAQGLYFLDKQGFGTAWKEEEIFWMDVSSQPKRSDYDGIRVTFVLQNVHYRLADTLRTGYTASHLTNDVSFTFRAWNWLPLSIQYHSGYGPDLSTYYVSSQFLTVGCELYDYVVK